MQFPHGVLPRPVLWGDKKKKIKRTNSAKLGLSLTLAGALSQPELFLTAYIVATVEEHGSSLPIPVTLHCPGAAKI